MLISIASFYATFLQADAAEKQVKAMTLPLIQHYTGNYDDKTKEVVIYFTLENAGVGPALIKSVSYIYKGVEYPSRHALLAACCDKERNAYHQEKNNGAKDSVGSVSSSILNTIIPAQTKVRYYQLYQTATSNNFWQKLDDVRFQVKMKVCYCSLLDECYVTEKNGFVEPVSACPV